METDSACSYIHLEVNISSLKDLNYTTFKDRFYAKRKNLQSIKTKISKYEKELLECESLSPKMYEYVGMELNHH